MSYTIDEDGNIDRGENPKNPGDRGFGHGDQVTLEFHTDGENLAEQAEAGQFVNFDGEGGVYRPVDRNDGTNPLEYDAVLKHDVEDGELVTVHVRGAIRAGEYAAHDGEDGEPDSSLESAWPVITALDDGDYLIALR